jgi:hypothetical protein
MPRNILFILMHHRHKVSDLINHNVVRPGTDSDMTERVAMSS